MNLNNLFKAKSINVHISLKVLKLVRLRNNQSKIDYKQQQILVAGLVIEWWF